MRVFQPDGYLSLDFHHSTVEIYRRIAQEGSSLPEIKGEQYSLQKRDALQEEIRSFIEACQKRTSPVVSAENALEALKLADQIVKQIKQMAKQYYPRLTKDLPAFRL